ncbi:unnamed protein product [Arctia plantaginis]|uniref:Uncharacterized protein n=1 Tax=Arctia plantaginis TaxID=874455 RepID=A0A8S0YYM9_ARCPL|nr:unnamed protein product [Arctia plantaginis]
MRCVSLVLIFLVTAMATASDDSEKRYYDVADALKEFEKFKATYKREYKDEADKQVHFEAGGDEIDAWMAPLTKFN